MELRNRKIGDDDNKPITRASVTGSSSGASPSSPTQLKSILKSPKKTKANGTATAGESEDVSLVGLSAVESYIDKKFGKRRNKVAPSRETLARDDELHIMGFTSAVISALWIAYAIGQRFYRPFIQLSYPVTTDQLLDHDHHDQYHYIHHYQENNGSQLYFEIGPKDAFFLVTTVFAYLFCHSAFAGCFGRPLFRKLTPKNHHHHHHRHHAKNRRSISSGSSSDTTKDCFLRLQYQSKCLFSIIYSLTILYYLYSSTIPSRDHQSYFQNLGFIGINSGSVVGDIVINGYIKILDTFSDTFNLIAQRYVGDSVVVVVPLATKLIVLVDCGSHIARILELWCSELADSRIAGILLHTSLCMLSFLGFQMGLVNQALTVVGISCVMTLTNAVSTLIFIRKRGTLLRLTWLAFLMLVWIPCLHIITHWVFFVVNSFYHSDFWKALRSEETNISTAAIKLAALSSSTTNVMVASFLFAFVLFGTLLYYFVSHFVAHLIYFNDIVRDDILISDGDYEEEENEEEGEKDTSYSPKPSSTSSSPSSRKSKGKQRE